MFTHRELEAVEVKFSFSTDVEGERLRNEVEPLKGEIEIYKQKLNIKQEQHRHKKLEVYILNNQKFPIIRISDKPNF